MMILLVACLTKSRWASTGCVEMRNTTTQKLRSQTKLQIFSRFFYEAFYQISPVILCCVNRTFAFFYSREEAAENDYARRDGLSTQALSVFRMVRLIAAYRPCAS